jgi:hypothetical protein
MTDKNIDPGKPTIKTWYERYSELGAAANELVAERRKGACRDAEIADLRAALAAPQPSAEPAHNVNRPLLIARIKRYRDASGCSLATAKEICEYGRDMNAEQTEFLVPRPSAEPAPAAPMASSIENRVALFFDEWELVLPSDAREALRAIVGDAQYRKKQPLSVVTNPAPAAPAVAAEAVRAAAQALLDDALEEVAERVHPADTNNVAAKVRELPPLMQNLYRALAAQPAPAPSEEVLALHRLLAAEKLRADKGWQRYEAKNRECLNLREKLAAPAPLNVQSGGAEIRGPLTDVQRDECRHLYNNLKHLESAGHSTADDVIRKAAVYGYMNGRQDFGAAPLNSVTEQDAKDAARYRWLRDGMCFDTPAGQPSTMALAKAIYAPDHNPHKDWVSDRFIASVDRTIDAAMTAPHPARKEPQMSNELKPCPLCGCHGLKFTSDAANPKRHTIKCDDCPCGAEFYSSDRQQAIDAWNRRAPVSDQVFGEPVKGPGFNDTFGHHSTATPASDDAPPRAFVHVSRGTEEEQLQSIVCDDELPLPAEGEHGAHRDYIGQDPWVQEYSADQMRQYARDYHAHMLHKSGENIEGDDHFACMLTDLMVGAKKDRIEAAKLQEVYDYINAKLAQARAAGAERDGWSKEPPARNGQYVWRNGKAFAMALVNVRGGKGFPISDSFYDGCDVSQWKGEWLSLAAAPSADDPAKDQKGGAA